MFSRGDSVKDYFIWNMDREIVHLFGPFSLRWYSLFFILAFVVGNFIFLWILRRENKPAQLCEPFVYYVVLGTVIGARLGHCLFYDPIGYLSNPLNILKVWEGGLASHGGYAGVLISIYFFSRKYKELSFFWLADRITIVAILGGSFIRIGNFFNSEIIGRVTNVPWAIIFQKVDPYPRHPAQLYESLGYFVISMIMLLAYRYTNLRAMKGRLLGLACALSFSFRALIETVKENQVHFENGLPFNMGQLLSVPFIILGLLLLMGVQQNFFKSK